MLTARGEPHDRVRGLEIGVDDYLSKPFEPRELLLRIGSVLAPHPGGARSASPRPRSCASARSRFRSSAANCAPATRSCGSPSASAKCCAFSAPMPGASVSREALSGSGGAAQERTVDVLINRLRRKIEHDPANPAYLQTARGAGYRLIADG